MPNNFNIREIVNDLGQEIDLVLESRDEERYFQEIILLYSLIENLLKWLVFIKIIWQKTPKSPSQEETEKLQHFCSRLDFYTALNVGLSLNLMDFNQYKRIDTVRKERNDILHQLWIYTHRRDFSVLRKKLEKLTGAARQLAKTARQLTDEIGVEEVYQVKL